MSYQPQTEAATSRFLNVEEAGKTLRIHFNDCGQGDETVVLLHGSGPVSYTHLDVYKRQVFIHARVHRANNIGCEGVGSAAFILHRAGRIDRFDPAIQRVVISAVA